MQSSPPSDVKNLIAPPDFVPVWLENWTDEQYFGDKTAIGSSSIRTMLDSPAAFHAEFTGLRKKKITDSMRLGSLLHKFILEGEKVKGKYIVEPHFTGKTLKGELTDNPNCKEVKEKRAQWLLDLPQDLIVVTEDEREKIIGVIGSIMKHPQARDLLNGARTEICGMFRDPETGIRIKFKPDAWQPTGVALGDLKAAASTEVNAFSRACFEGYRHDVQLWTYSEGAYHVSGRRPDLIALLGVEYDEPPYEVGVFFFQPDDLIQAEIDYRSCLRKIRQGIDTNAWPQRQTQWERIIVPESFKRKSNERNERDAYVSASGAV